MMLASSSDEDSEDSSDSDMSVHACKSHCDGRPGLVDRIEHLQSYSAPRFTLSMQEFITCMSQRSFAIEHRAHMIKIWVLAQA